MEVMPKGSKYPSANSGLWQVKGRSALSFEEMVQLDIEYIEKQSLWLDLKILVSTVAALAATERAE
jgi:lipopolysaccharide/colanic/teichoic acid biosynthesis glycosyltransferase